MKPESVLPTIYTLTTGRGASECHPKLSNTFIMLDKLTIDDFSPSRLGAFPARFAGGGSTTLDLVATTPFPQVPTKDGDTARRPFSVTFRAPIPVNIPQGMITLEHDRHGPLDIFVVPVGRDAQGLLLEAVFN